MDEFVEVELPLQVAEAVVRGGHIGPGLHVAIADACRRSLEARGVALPVPRSGEAPAGPVEVVPLREVEIGEVVRVPGDGAEREWWGTVTANGGNRRWWTMVVRPLATGSDDDFRADGMYAVTRCIDPDAEPCSWASHGRTCHHRAVAAASDPLSRRSGSPESGPMCHLHAARLASDGWKVVRIRGVASDEEKAGQAPLELERLNHDSGSFRRTWLADDDKPVIIERRGREWSAIRRSRTLASGKTLAEVQERLQRFAAFPG